MKKQLRFLSFIFVFFSLISVNVTAQNNWTTFMSTGVIKFLTFSNSGTYAYIQNGNAIVDGYTITGLPGTPKHITYDNQGYAYISTSNGLVKYTISTNDTTIIRFPDIGNSINTTIFDNNGKLWVGRSGRATMIDSNDTITYSLSTPYSLAVDASNKIWAGGNSTLSYFDGNTWFTYTTSNSDVPEGCLNKLLFDDEQNLWSTISCMPNNSAGFTKFDGTTFTTVSGWHRTLAQTPDGKIWFGTYGNGLLRYNPQDSTSYWYTHVGGSPLRYDFIEYLTVDNNGCLYICYDTGLSESYGVSKLCSSTSIDETSIAEEVNLYPNPSNGLFSIETELKTEGNILIDLRNTLGQLVYSFSENANAGLYKKEINLNVADGIYYLALSTVEGSATRKIVMAK